MGSTHSAQLLHLHPEGAEISDVMHHLTDVHLWLSKAHIQVCRSMPMCICVCIGKYYTYPFTERTIHGAFKTKLNIVTWHLKNC